MQLLPSPYLSKEYVSMSIKIYFGVPGSGKTTHAASVVRNNLKHGIVTYCNVDIVGSIRFSVSDDLGRFQIENADMIIDEAGIEFNNRQYKSLPKYVIEWLKLYRHYGIRNIYVYSQSYEDMDITIRRLADQIFVVRRSLIPFFIATRRINVKVGIDDDTHQIIDKYFFQIFSLRLFFAPQYWGMFDSWTAPRLLDKDWQINENKPFIVNGTVNDRLQKLYLRETYKELCRKSKLRYRLARAVERAVLTMREKKLKKLNEVTN